MECFRRAVALDPGFADAHANLGILLLLTGHFAEGWPEYELRSTAQNLDLGRPRWTGGDLAGQTILLHSEQGFGDALQFIRYAPRVKQHGGTVLVECKAPLARLLASCPGVDRVIPAENPCRSSIATCRC